MMNDDALWCAIYEETYVHMLKQQDSVDDALVEAADAADSALGEYLERFATCDDCVAEEPPRHMYDAGKDGPS